MPSIIFYSEQNEAAAIESTLLKLVTRRYRSGQRIFIRCEDQQQMLQLDEALWQQDTESFLAHAIDGEPSADKAPILLATNNPQNPNGFGCWVNLTSSAIVPLPRTEEIIEIVPADESGKQLARDRYKAYCQQGIKPAFQDLTSTNTK